MSAEHLAGRERRQRRAALVRADIVRALLAGDPVDLRTAEQTLGHRFDRAQQCFVCWSASPSTQLERAATAVAAALGSTRPLLIPEGSDAVTGWVTPTGPGEGHDAVEAARRAAAPDVSVGIGSVGIGIDGFRTSHDERIGRAASQRSPAAPQRASRTPRRTVDLLSADSEAPGVSSPSSSANSPRQMPPSAPSATRSWRS